MIDMGSPALAAALAVAAFVVSTGGTRLVLGWLRRRAVLDIPNERSSHSVPTPRGGGLAVSAVLLTAWAGAFALTPPTVPVAAGVALAAATGLYVLSFADDRLNLPRRWRLLAHAAAVAAALAVLPGDLLVFQGWLPLALDRVLAALCWVWFVNLYNFMDGIDGITGVETASIGIGLAVVGAVAVAGPALPYPAMGAAAAGAAVGFLVFNWHPAKLFLGDVGSIPLGYLLGFALLVLAAQGHLVAALILPAYHVSDATVTLLRRVLIERHPIGQAHREHFYQRAVHRAGLSHAQVSARIAVGNGVLVSAAIVAETASPVAGIGLAVAVVSILLASFARRR